MTLTAVAAICDLAIATAGGAIAQTVKVTPAGGIKGALCRPDRATLFEDPDGTGALHDAGMTVAGPDDPRLGALLLSHMHGDHAGARHNSAVDAGSCAMPDLSAVAVPEPVRCPNRCSRLSSSPTSSADPGAWCGSRCRSA